MHSGRRIALVTGLAAAVAGLVAAPSPTASRAAQPAAAGCRRPARPTRGARPCR